MDLVGKILADRYEIIEEVGKGGMARVYKAWCKILNRFVAIKVLKEEFKDDKEFVRRFNVEAQAAAGISNPHVVSIYDVGYEEGLYYIVMEYVEGITLKEYIAEKGSLSWREAVSFAAQICEGLAAAHRANVVHRDIKPQNIIMAQARVLKVTDFGIARASSQGTMTMGGNAIGTVHYLSPEQARGGYTDQRTDIYSLGIVLYEMLTGQLPFTDDSPVAVAIKHIQEQPKPIRELNPEVPASVEAVTLRAMKKEQSVRYASAEAFLSDLEHVLMNPSCDIEERESKHSVTIDDMDSTIQMGKIDDEAIERYEREKRATQRSGNRSRTRNNEERSAKTGEIKLREVDERKLRNEQKRKERKVTLVAILTAVLIIVSLGVAFSALTGGINFGQHAEVVEVPDLLGMDIEKARHDNKDVFSIVRKSEKPSDEPAGTILEQSPEEGEKVKGNKETVIYVVVSSGSNSKVLENYVGETSENAQKKLKEAGLQVNVIERKDDNSEEGKVFAQEPVAGSVISNGGLVVIYVNKDKKDAELIDETSNTEEKKDSEKTENAEKTESTSTSTSAKEPEKTTTPAKEPSSTTVTTPAGGGLQE